MKQNVNCHKILIHVLDGIDFGNGAENRGVRFPGRDIPDPVLPFEYPDPFFPLEYSDPFSLYEDEIFEASYDRGIRNRDTTLFHTLGSSSFPFSYSILS